ncbi:MAG: aspartate aminotransferase family protein [Candidatus Dormibacteraeota bacterium]|uniref:glutamate-1-semialdehyde 2,1-aminomutase n=1 Tax=Candidatus Aeolococcus gillhamiae TaxID=3127015 RepID=A0A934K0V8_9BACT|nr:aspartate aminotransferase family protein [Candidatus Dormibacteraeota bacterium]
MLANAEQLLPGGGVTSLSLPGGVRKVIARGKGSRIWDVAGDEYVDYLLGSGPLIAGHAHPAVVDAVQRQAALGSTFYAVTEPILRLAQRIVDSVPCAEMVQFCTSGSEATAYALRIARAATGRDAVLKFEGGFHGANDYAQMSLFPSVAATYPSSQPSSGGIPHALVEDVLVVPFNDLGQVRAVVEENRNRLSAIIVEPVQRVIEPVPGFLQGLRDLATRYGIVLIFDEIVTGFRLGEAGAQGYYGVKPDLATYGKIIGGGYPLAAVAGQSTLMELADPGRRGKGDYVYFSGTLNGNPIAAVAGLATMELLDDAAYKRLFAAGERLRGGLQDAFARHDIAVRVLGIGPMFQVLITDETVRDYWGMQRADSVRLKKIAAAVFQQGFFLSGDKGYLSLAHTDDDLDRTIQAFAVAIRSQSD